MNALIKGISVVIRKSTEPLSPGRPKKPYFKGRLETQYKVTKKMPKESKFVVCGL
jgi:hypothetical protein